MVSRGLLRIVIVTFAKIWKEDYFYNGMFVGINTYPYFRFQPKLKVHE